MIELKGATKRFGPLAVLDNFNFKLPDSGVVAILGTSGSGKTTLMRIIAGLEKLDSGQLIKPPEARVSMVFQEDRLIPGLSAAENILAALPPHPGNVDKTARILGACGLSRAAHLLPEELSGGMQRRVAIGRALAFGGDILLLDEPFKGLDPATREDVIRIVLSECEQRLILLVTHSMEEAERCADTILQFEGPPLMLKPL